MFLMIENSGVAPSEGFTMIGVSTTRNAGVSGTIGKFGSGTKFAINYFLRNNIRFIIFCGKLRIEFKTETLRVSDGLRSEDFNQVVARLDCSDPKNQIHRTEPLSWTTEHGLDWTCPMAMRELIANALDRTIREGLQPSDVVIKMVEDNQVRAKHGGQHTRIFVELTDDIMSYYNQINKRFLHWKSPSQGKGNQILEKDNREIYKHEIIPSVIYKEGVFVREKKTTLPAMFDYNISGLELDESRNADDYYITAWMSLLLAEDKNAARRNKLLDALIKDEKWQETTDVSSYHLQNCATKQEVKQLWQETWNNFLPKNSVLNTSMASLNDRLRRKGYNPIRIESSAWQDFLVQCGIPTEAEILTDHEKNGVDILPPTREVINALNKIWHLLDERNMLKNKQKPEVFVYDKTTEEGTITMGLYKDNKIGIHLSLANGTNSMLYETMLEEVVHHITGATDMSRDFQEYLLKLCIKLWKL